MEQVLHSYILNKTERKKNICEEKKTIDYVYVCSLIFGITDNEVWKCALNCFKKLLK